MASQFVVPDRDQVFLELVSFHQVLGEDHLVWTVVDVVEGLDLSVLYDQYLPDTGGGGRPAFDPKMMVALLFYAYCEGELSSRDVETACRRDMAYRAICGNLEPDHATIARFRVRMDPVLEDLFAQVLMMCADAGMVDVGVVALDGTRMGSVASIEANRTGPKIAQMQVKARQMLDAANRADTETCTPDADDADTDPGNVVDRAEGANTDTGSGDSPDSPDSPDAGDAGSGGLRRSSRSRRVTDMVRRAGRVEAAYRVVVDAEQNRAGEETKRQKRLKPVANVTDPESRLQKTRGGFIQGYNAQSVVSSDQVVIACDVTPDSTDAGQFIAMLEASKHNVTQAGVTAKIGVALADAGYASQANFDAEQGLGMCLLVSTSKRRNVKAHAATVAQRQERDRARIDVFVRIRAGAYTYTQAAKVLGLSPAWTGSLYRTWRDTGSLASPALVAWQAMTDRLSEPANKALYKQRSPKIEGSYAHIKTHRGIRAFTRHGLKACRAEWNLINLTGNLMKLHKKLHKTLPATPNNQSRHRFRPIFGLENVPHRLGTRIWLPSLRIRCCPQPIHQTT